MHIEEHISINRVKHEIELIECHKARGAIIRSKCRWTEEGEKNTSFFLRLEKHNFSNKLITQLNVDDHMLNEPSDILNAGKIFYDNLYTEKNQFRNI